MGTYEGYEDRKAYFAIQEFQENEFRSKLGWVPLRRSRVLLAASSPNVMPHSTLETDLTACSEQKYKYGSRVVTHALEGSVSSELRSLARTPEEIASTTSSLDVEIMLSAMDAARSFNTSWWRLTFNVSHGVC